MVRAARPVRPRVGRKGYAESERFQAGSSYRTARLLAGGLYVLFAAAVTAAIIFDTTLFVNFGPFTGAWVVLVISGNAVLRLATLYSWWSVSKRRRAEHVAETNR